MAEDAKFTLAKEIIRTHDLLHRWIVSTFSDEPSVLALTPQQMAMLVTVRELGQASVKELAEKLRVTTSSVSTMVERLVEAKVLSREPNPSDRRAVIVRVHPDTEKRIDPIERQALKSLVSLIDRLDPKYTQYWHEVNLQISAALE